jgi:hypothetical protein
MRCEMAHPSDICRKVSSVLTFVANGSLEARVVVYDPLEKVLSMHLESDVQSGFIIDLFHCRERQY